LSSEIGIWEYPQSRRARERGSPVCVWSEGAFARFDDVVDYKFALLPRFLRRPLVQAYYLLGWMDCRLWGPSVNPIQCLQDTAAPIFICHGERDELVPLAEGQALLETYTGPKQHWWVEGASHYNVRQRHHKEYLERLRAFLEDCLRP
jgi:pimeloyl-ACP methyl ester carboxylesterase